MANPEETHRKTIFERLKEIIPLVTPILMFSAIALTYFTYFFDVSKTPQLVIQNEITKLHESEDYYIVKISLKIKNQSKTRVEVVANLGKLYAYQCDINDLNNNDSSFIEGIVDSTHKIDMFNRGEAFEMHSTIDWYNERLIGFYQPLHNSSWMLPEETLSHEIISAVPKIFDVIYYYYMIDFTRDEKGIFSHYIKDKDGDPEYHLYTLKGDDTVSIREFNVLSEDSLLLASEYNIYVTGSQYVAWLNTGSNIKKSLDTLSSLPDDDEAEEK